MKFFSVYKMQERHNILWNSIGYLDEEQKALERGYQILVSSVVWLILGSLGQAIFFQLYNDKLHPFANILKNPKTPEGNSKT